MTEYMIALREQFDHRPQITERIERELERIRQELSNQLSISEQDMLLDLLDLEAELRDEISLSSFISGYRLAYGIHRELSQMSPCSFDRKTEERVGQCIINEGG